MQKAAHSSFRPRRLLTLLAAFSLSAGVQAADKPEFNSLWAELRSSAQVSCPKDVALPRPLIAAAACGDLARVRDRVMAGADLAATDPRPALAGRSALHHAAQRGDAGMLSLLLDAGADPNAIDGQGNTPLHLLAASPKTDASVEMARQLLAFGADARLENDLGRSAAATLETEAERRISPLHMDRKALLELLLQAQATGPMRTAEPSLVVATPAPQPAQDATAEPPAPDGAPPSDAAPAQQAAAEPEAPAEATPEPKAEPEPAPEPKAETKPKPEPSPEPKAEAKPKPEPTPEPKVETRPKPEPAAAAKANAKPEPAPEPKAEAKAEPAPAPKAETKPEPRAAKADSGEVDAALRSWAADWSSGDAEAYLRHYSKHFVPSDGNTLKAWQQQRRARVGKPASIRVSLSDVEIEIDGKRAVARFMQDYQRDDYKVVNRKVVEFAHEGRSWKIVSERDEG